MRAAVDLACHAASQDTIQCVGDEPFYAPHRAAPHEHTPSPAERTSSVAEVRNRMPARTCVICGKPMDAKPRSAYVIKSKVTHAEKHAHAECVQREPEKARAEGFVAKT